MCRFDNIHGDEDEIEYEYRRIQEIKEYDREEEEIEEWQLSRVD
jgi:hypothetical protein